MCRRIEFCRGVKLGVACLAMAAVPTAWATEHARDGARASDVAKPSVGEASRDAAKAALNLAPQTVPSAGRDTVFPSSQIPHIDLGLHTGPDLDLGGDIRRVGAGPDRAPDARLAMSSPVGPLAEKIRNMRRDGLPLVHLWQGAHGGFSLGLNARGKPGLWLVEKVP